METIGNNLNGYSGFSGYRRLETIGKHPMGMMVLMGIATVYKGVNAEARGREINE